MVELGAELVEWELEQVLTRFIFLALERLLFLYTKSFWPDKFDLAFTCIILFILELL
jgi:hypothetical protein